MKFIEVSNDDRDKLVSLDKYIEELKYFYDSYSKGDIEDEMVEELIMYECLISWLEELKHYREGEYPYMADCTDEDDEE